MSQSSRTPAGVAPSPEATPAGEPHTAPLSQLRSRKVLIWALVLVAYLIAAFGVTGLLQASVDGLRLGVSLALIGVGLSLVFSTTGVFNFAQGEFATLGAVITWLFNASMGIPLLLSAVIAVIVGGLAGYATERLLWRPLRGRKMTMVGTFVVAIGLGLAIRHAILFFFGGSAQSYTEYVIQDQVEFLGVRATPKAIFTIVIGLVVLIGLGLFLRYTTAGQSIRAVASNRLLADASGINANRSIALVWTISGALAALGGILMALDENASWDMGNRILLLVFAGVTLGGLGTVSGAIGGGIILGIVTQASTLWLPTELKYLSAMLVLLVMLVFRPSGLFGKKQRIG